MSALFATNLLNFVRLPPHAVHQRLVTEDRIQTRHKRRDTNAHYKRLVKWTYGTQMIIISDAYGFKFG